MARRRKSGLEGVTPLRKKLRRADDEITKELRSVVAEGLQAIKMDAIALAPVDEGDLVRSIDISISRDGMTGVVGPGVKTAEIVRRRTNSAWGSVIKRGKARGEKIRLSDMRREELWQFFKGYWIEFGTKGSARKNIPPQPARPFMGPAYLANRAWLKSRVNAAVNNVLARLAKEK